MLPLLMKLKNCRTEENMKSLQNLTSQDKHHLCLIKLYVYLLECMLGRQAGRLVGRQTKMF